MSPNQIPIAFVKRLGIDWIRKPELYSYTYSYSNSGVVFDCQKDPLFFPRRQEAGVRKETAYVVAPLTGPSLGDA